MKMLTKIKRKAASGRRALSFSLTLALALTLGMTPVPAYGAGTIVGDFEVDGGVLGSDYTYAANVLTFTTPGAFTVSMTAGVPQTTADAIAVNAPGSSEGNPVQITLVEVDIDKDAGGCALDIQGSSVVRLILDGANALRSGAGNAGLQISTVAALTIDVIGGIDAAGSLTVTGGFNSAGIGGSAHTSNGMVTIMGGMVTAYGGDNGAGIGGGGSDGGFGDDRNAGSGGTITISGGHVIANSGGGFYSGAGIGGGGMGGTGTPGDGGTITISGGTVVATGDDEGAGIGGGSHGNGGTIAISGGQVTATGGSAGAGIGGGRDGDAGTIAISGGQVTAMGSYYGAGIGGGGNGGDGGTIAISGGQVTAMGSYYGAGIGGGSGGAGGTVTISGGAVNAAATSGAGIGGGVAGDGGTVSITGGIVSAASIQGAGIGGGGAITATGGDGGTVDISGGIVLAEGKDGAKDIGSGSGGTDGSLGIAGTAAVFLKGGSSAAPVTATHTHVENIDGTTGGSLIYGLAKPWLDDDDYGAYLRLITLSYDANGGNNPPASVQQHIGTTETVSDGAGMNWTGHTFTRWDTASAGDGTAYATGSAFTFTTDTALYAQWTAIPPPPSGGGSGSKRYSAGVSGDGTGSIPITVNTGAENASVDINDQIGGNVAGGGNVTITVPPIPGVSSYTAGIPVAYLSVPGGGTLTFKTNTGSMTLPSDMLAGIPGAEGRKAEITIGQGDKSGLPGGIQDAIGGRPLIRLSMTLDGKQTDWNNPDAPVTVSIPYKPTAEELANPENIVIWYIDGSGNAVCIPNGHYDPDTGTVTFSVTHFSLFGVTYNEVIFADVASTAWYYKAVSFIAARDITTGTGGGNFSPGAKLTRGQFLVMLMKAYEIAPDTAGPGNFSDAGDTYYTGYLAAAKRLGISGGVGNNLFAPEKEITRQEMFTLLYNALKVIGQLPNPAEGSEDSAGAGTPGAGSAGNSLPDFSDADQIASWAREALALLVESGAVSGSSGKLNPAGTTTRAEMAQVLYNLLSI